VLSVVRQLAEAERSPITAIEEQHQAEVRDQLRQPPRPLVSSLAVRIPVQVRPPWEHLPIAPG